MAAVSLMLPFGADTFTCGEVTEVFDCSWVYVQQMQAHSNFTTSLSWKLLEYSVAGYLLVTEVPNKLLIYH